MTDGNDSVGTAVDIETVELPANLYRMIDFEPHGGQLDLRKALRIPRKDENDPLYYTIFAARQWGKTKFASTLMLEAAFQPYDDVFGPPNVGLVSDTYEHAHKIFDLLVRYLYDTDLRALVASYDREYNAIRLVPDSSYPKWKDKPGARIQMMSADREQSMTGEGWTTMLIDEAQFVPDRSMGQLWPSFTPRKATVIAFGVPENDGGWFNTWEDRGNDPDYPEYATMSFPWWTSPFLPKQIIDISRRDLTADDFARRYEARRPTAAGSLFGNLANCLINVDHVVDPHFDPYVIEKPVQGKLYVGGVDVAKVNDYTNVQIYDYDTGRMVFFFRLPHQAYSVQSHRVAKYVAAYSARMLFDVTGVGQSVIEQFRDALNLHYQEEYLKSGKIPERRGHYEEQTFTGGEKNDMVDKLSLLIEKERIHFPNISPFVKELRKYRKDKTQSGRIVTGAPEGGHDDTVSAAMLASKLLPIPILAVAGEVRRERASWERNR